MPSITVQRLRYTFFKSKFASSWTFTSFLAFKPTVLSLFPPTRFMLSSVFNCPPGRQSHIPPAEEEENGEETDVSLITGALRSRNLLLSAPEESPCSSSLVLRNQTMTVANTNSAGRLDPTFKVMSTRGHFWCGTIQTELNFVPFFFPSPQHPSCRSEAGRVWSRSWERRPSSRPGRAGKESRSRMRRRERPDNIELFNIKTVNCLFNFYVHYTVIAFSF